MSGKALPTKDVMEMTTEIVKAIVSGCSGPQPEYVESLVKATAKAIRKAADSDEATAAPKRVPKSISVLRDESGRVSQ